MREDHWFDVQVRRAAKRQPAPRAPSPRWKAIANAYRATGQGRPSQLEVAGQLDRSEGTLRRWLRELGMQWTDVHARMNASKQPAGRKVAGNGR
jgi:hypothetical protein